MKSLVRAIYNSPKLSHFDSTCNVQLDLAYIAPNILVSSAPGTLNAKQWFLYPLQDLLRFLNTHHGQKWHIFNLQGEGSDYAKDDVGGKVSYFKFPDHQVPPLIMMEKIVEEIHKLLDADAENTVLLHCKAGKGRSGTIVCAYLIYECFLRGKVLSVIESNDLFTLKRMKPFTGQGVSILSQIRYLQYWQQHLLFPELVFPPEDSYTIRTIQINGPTKVTAKFIAGLKLTIDNYTKNSDGDGVELTKRFRFDTNTCKYKVDFDKNYVRLYPGIKSGNDARISIHSFKHCYCWWNLPMESFGALCGHVRMYWDDFDGFRGFNLKGKQDFESVDVYWTIGCESKEM